MGMDIIVPGDEPECRMISDLEILERMIPLIRSVLNYGKELGRKNISFSQSLIDEPFIQR